MTDRGSAYRVSAADRGLSVASAGQLVNATPKALSMPEVARDHQKPASIWRQASLRGGKTSHSSTLTAQRNP
jgi:hypothetical protein